MKYDLVINNDVVSNIYISPISDKTSYKCSSDNILYNSHQENIKDFLVLVPADEGLFEYYKKFGFVNNSNIGTYQNVSTEEKISEKEYFLLRDKYFKNRNYIKWDEKQLFDIASLYGANFYKNKESTEIAMLSKNRVIEYLGNSQPLCEKPFSMIFPKDFKNSYFNIAID